MPTERGKNPSALLAYSIPPTARAGQISGHRRLTPGPAKNKVSPREFSSSAKSSRRFAMRNRTALVILAALAFSPFVWAQQTQTPQPGAQQGRGRNMRAQKEKAPSAPAPVQDISGVWAGTAAPHVNPPPPMTPYGEALFQSHKPFFGPALVPVAESNDPMITCDPLGFPRDVLFEIRGIKFAQLPKETLELFQYQRTWREIWTDGRALPANVGGTAVNAPDPRYYGYSVGHWDGDYTFVVNTAGLDERTWLDEYGHVKSGEAKVEERYHRLDHDTLELTVTVDDPKTYTTPYLAETFDFKWNPKQEFEEQLCIPSDMATYMKTIARPADTQTKK
jgi:hypothetical protein